MPNEDLLRLVKAGESPSASQHNLIVTMLRQLVDQSSPAAFMDSIGSRTRKFPSNFRWVRGILNSDFPQGGTADITVQIIDANGNLQNTTDIKHLVDPTGMIGTDPLATILGSSLFGIPACTCVIAVSMTDTQSKGQWEPVKFIQCQTPSTTSTTTTPKPSTAGVCGGTCRMSWDATTALWSLESGMGNNACFVPTTTTTTTTTPSGSTTTTTTTTPRPLCTTSTSTSSTTTPGGSTTTTTSTTPPPCQCQYPTWCGTFDGECTVTTCENKIPQQVCTTSTTTAGGPTSSTTTSSTTPNPACTTTTPNCGPGCTWCDLPVLGWVLVSGGCNYPCTCSEPSGDGSACATSITACGQSTYSPPYIPCEGKCSWVYLAGSDCAGSNLTLYNGWLLTAYSCSSNSNCQPCSCPAPPGTAACGATTYTDCGCTTPTTPNPCISTDTSTSTTTFNPCNQKCKWKADTADSGWTNLSNPCPGSCPCNIPYYSGSEDCETAMTNCDPSNTTTTSTSTTTTSTSTTSTSTTSSTTCNPSNQCSWTCTNYGAWSPGSKTQAGVCTAGSCNTCCPPTIPCPSTDSSNIAVAYTQCQVDPTCPTTTTTTCSPAGCQWICYDAGGQQAWSQFAPFTTLATCPSCSQCCAPVIPCDTASNGLSVLIPCISFSQSCPTTTTTTTCNPSSGSCSWICQYLPIPQPNGGWQLMQYSLTCPTCGICCPPSDGNGNPIPCTFSSNNEVWLQQCQTPPCSL